MSDEKIGGLINAYWNVEASLIDRKTGEVVQRECASNLITTSGKQVFSRVVAPNVATNTYSGWAAGTLSGISVGLNGTAAAVTDWRLGDEYGGAAGCKSGILEVSYPSPGVLTVKTTYGASDVNNSGLQEAGLWFGYHGANAVLVARNTFGSITKTSAFDLAISWTLTFS